MVRTLRRERKQQVVQEGMVVPVARVVPVVDVVLLVAQVRQVQAVVAMQEVPQGIVVMVHPT